MIHLLSLLGFVASFLAGALFRERVAWPIIFLVPLLGTITFTIVPSDLFPLTFYRIALAVTLGLVATDPYRFVLLRRLGASRMVQIAAVFYLPLIFLSLQDQGQFVVFSLVPRLVVSFVLCYLVVKTDRELLRLARVMVWGASIIALSAIVEFSFGLSVAASLASTIPNFELETLQTVGFREMERAGFYRAAGITGSAISTGYTLAFYFPIALWFAMRRGWTSGFPLVLVGAGLVLVQTRAAFVAIAASLAWLAIQHLSLDASALLLRRVALRTAPLALLVGLLVLAFPNISGITTAFVTDSLLPSFSGVNELNEEKLMRLPYAYERFLEHPLLGHGSPIYAYTDVMLYQDVPGPVIYALAGGLPLLCAYSLMLFYLPHTTSRLARRPQLGATRREFLWYASAAFVAGVIVVFSNPKDDHFYLMFMLYVAIYRVWGVAPITKPTAAEGRGSPHQLVTPPPLSNVAETQ